MGNMEDKIIKIAAAIITDDAGRLLLVRKKNTKAFMQAGGKIDAGEDAACALIRELGEELGVCIAGDALRALGTYSAPAANEAGCVVEANLFTVQLSETPEPKAEIEEMIWVAGTDIEKYPLAPLTKDIVFPLAAELQRQH